MIFTRRIARPSAHRRERTRATVRLTTMLVALAATAGFPARAADGALFAEKVRPILEKHCFKCHGHASGRNKGGLLLDSRAAMLEGGDSGPAIEPGAPEASLLMKAIGHKDPHLQMPPKDGKLDDAEVEAIAEWIRQGASWPDDSKNHATGRIRGKITDEDRRWWAFQPVKPVSVPEPARHAPVTTHPIDRFIQSRLDQEGLAPAPEAPPTAIIRRVTFDLTGLPPTPGEVTAFLAETAPGAYERLVDRLLSSPRHGERMARSWLDLVRYADGDGYRADDYRPDAWRYRDYVIQAFNDDKPYDRFLKEQLAGDELFPGDPDALIATGYLRHGIYEWNARDVRGQWDVILNDLTDTTGDVFLGLGMQCARCHDHKFDPILQRDYFRLRAFFAPILLEDRLAVTANQRAAHAAKMAVWETKTAKLRAELAALEQPYLDRVEAEAVGRFPDDIQAMIRKPLPERAPLEAQLASLAWRQVVYDWERVDRLFKGGDKERILKLRRELAAFEAGKPARLPVAFAATDVGECAPPVTIPKRGPEPVEPGFLTLLDPAPAKIGSLPGSTGRRAALANWLASPENPLTARVMVNRVWQQHFGRGLAANASDFGKLGEHPSHPDLLDWLAHRFVREGWSLKKLRRLIVTSAAYRRSSHHPEPEAGRLKDPENLLLWRARPRRLEAEQIRDAMLAVSGELKFDAGGPGVPSNEPRRTIYTRFMRNARDPLADVFDAPLWFSSAASRDTTTTPVQALLLANSAALRARGKAFANRVATLVPEDPAGQVDAAYRLAFGREASPSERRAATEFLVAQTASADERRLTSGQSFFVPEKIPYRDGQGAFLQPGSEQAMFSVEGSAGMSVDGAFTIEAFIVPRSISEGPELRTIAARWTGAGTEGGWSLGITGKQSRRKPLTLALQVIGRRSDGSFGERPVFSDLGVQVGKPYFVAAAFTPANQEQPGRVLFALKDLSNDDEPLLTASIEHDIVGEFNSAAPLTLGARSGAAPQQFHGVIDDVRLSRAALAPAQMLFGAESVIDSTLGFWRFEARPDVFADASGNARNLVRPASPLASPLTPGQAALGDFCQALLNASEFLYTE